MRSPAAVFNIRNKSNENFRLSLTVQDAAGTPIDLTDAVGKMAIRVNATDSDAIYSASSDIDDTITIDLETATINIDVTVDIVSSWDFSEGVYDVVVAYDDTNWDTLVEGKFVLSQGVTHHG